MYGSSVAVDRDLVYVTGGDSPDTSALHQVFSYNITTNQWKQLPPSGHCCGVLLMIGQKLTIFGGQDSETYEIHNKVSTYNNSWISYFPNMLKARSKPGVTSYKDYVIVMGGTLGSGAPLLDSIEVMNWRERSHWRRCAISLPSPMYGIDPTISDNVLLIVGYGHAGGHSNVCCLIPVDVILSSLDQPPITSVLLQTLWKGLPFAPNYYTSTLPYSNPPMIIGGCDVNNITTSAINVFDTRRLIWRPVGSLSSARKAVSVATINKNTIIVIGGTRRGETTEDALSTSLTTVELGHIVPNQTVPATTHSQLV